MSTLPTLAPLSRQTGSVGVSLTSPLYDWIDRRELGTHWDQGPPLLRPPSPLFIFQSNLGQKTGSRSCSDFRYPTKRPG